MRKIISDGVEASTKKSQARFQIGIRLNNLKTSLRFPCLGLNTIIDSINVCMISKNISVVSDDGSKPEVLSRIAQATAALTKLKPIWRDNNISLGSKVKLMRSLVISIFLYACESWTLTAELEKRTQAFEMRCYRRLLNISYKDHVTNEEVCRKIQAAIGEYDELLTLVKK